MHLETKYYLVTTAWGQRVYEDVNAGGAEDQHYARYGEDERIVGDPESLSKQEADEIGIEPL